MTDAGQIVVLNGAPRSGKSSIVRAMQEWTAGNWMNIGVDVFARYAAPPALRPGIGLRPGGERPDLEPHLPVLFDALYGSVIAWAGLSCNVVVDVGHHDDFSTPLNILVRVARRLEALPAYFIGVRCPMDEIMARRDAGEAGRADVYVRSGPGGEVPASVLRWERAVHDPGIYDLEVDTSVLTPDGCASAIAERMGHGPPAAFAEIARQS